MKTLTVTKPFTRGSDVRHLQELLQRRKWLGGKLDGVYGPATAQAVYHAKLLLGYGKPDQVAGDVLVAYLSGKKKPTAAMRARARRLATVKPKAGETSRTPTSKQTKADRAAAHEAKVRADCVRVMHLLLGSEPRIHYAQIRPMATRTIISIPALEGRLTHGVTMDCSESSTLIARLAGAKDPNGHDFDQGVHHLAYTGEILDHCAAITRAQLKAGDQVVFGPGTGHHVCTVLEPGPDPLLFSHGQEKGPITIRLSVEAQYQPAGVRYRRLPI